MLSVQIRKLETDIVDMKEKVRVEEDSAKAGGTKSAVPVLEKKVLESQLKARIT